MEKIAFIPLHDSGYTEKKKENKTIGELDRNGAIQLSRQNSFPFSLPLFFLYLYLVWQSKDSIKVKPKTVPCHERLYYVPFI